MADYRDWCNSCGNEINFGGHDPDCDWMHAQRIARKELWDFEEELRQHYRSLTTEAMLDEAEELFDDIAALSQMLRAKERKWDYMRRYVLVSEYHLGALDKLKQRLGKNYL